MPDVPPPDFINACKAVMLNFGNVSSDNQDVMKKIQTIAAEAEIVATRIYGKGMSPQEQQDRAWKEESTSIFDLERMEVRSSITMSVSNSTPQFLTPTTQSSMLVASLFAAGRHVARRAGTLVQRFVRGRRHARRNVRQGRKDENRRVLS